MSQDALPRYTTFPQDDSLKDAPVSQASRFFLVLGGPAAPQYVRIPTSDSEVDLEKGLLTPVDNAVSLSGSPGVLAATQAPATQPSLVPSAPPPPSRITLANAFWLARMGLLLVVSGAGVSLVTSVISFYLGMVAVLGWYTPFGDISGTAAFTACAAGGPIVGAAAGATAFVALCVRRARTPLGELQEEARVDAKRARRQWIDSDEWRMEEPWELWGMMGVAALLGAFGLVVGLTVVPGLAGVAAEAGWSMWHAVAVGVWGVTVPFTPCIVGAVITTLTSCDPVRGFEGGCEFWMACATAGARSRGY
ncbi:hypothetical protein C8Q78DRAFT_990995 [Trametes maxima]|nr:hypothetical protein C8Q78DRAFT_990995 [Trametes maxima]